MANTDTDLRCYLTNAGIAAENNAIQLGRKLPIKEMVFGSGVLAEGEDPRNQTTMINEQFKVPCAMITHIDNTTLLTFKGDIPVDVGGFNINEVAIRLEDGTIYGYARGTGDYKPTPEQGATESIRYVVDMYSTNVSTIECKIDLSNVYVDYEDLNKEISSHNASSFPHEKNCGWKGTYEQVVIPLVPISNSSNQKLQRSEVNGRFTFRRGSSGASLFNTVVDVICSSSYNENQAYSLTVSQRPSEMSVTLVTFYFDGQSWLGLRVFGANPEANVSFNGSFENKNDFFNNQLRVIPYYNNQTESVMNTEISNSMAEYQIPIEPLLFGKRKIYHEGNLSHVIERLEGGQGLPWSADRIYKTGEICSVEINGEVTQMQMYAGPNLTCQGKNPIDESNRHDGWGDNTAPFWWIPYTGDQVGMPFFWLDNVAPEWAVMEINVDLPIAVYWRLARRYPHLVSGDIINTGEIRGEFLRVLDQGRGVNLNRQINTFEKHSLQHHNHLLPTGSGEAGSGLWGINDQYWMQTDGVNWSPVGGELALSGDYGSSHPLTLGGDWAAETRPRNIARPMAIAI
ncbi:phage tail protein [Vibrio lentus]|uniref:phage tail-collar fiber domain-containing protein n=1 Tax=Vibrio lentus TaxID=136468 RepID=UPI000C835092|nr:phage tail protein [Vibrio lentus]PML25092.1 hypothetical protein BCT80_20215 [Vibrio lentus]